MTVRDLTILGCSSQQPTRHRNHGGYLLRWRDEGFLFDPGEGTQRQFIFANVAPTCVTRIFVSHFHGDHCLGVGSMLMRLNLDKIPHPVHCYYPASGRVYFERLRYGTIYHENIQIIEHPIKQAGLVYEDAQFRVEAKFLKHGVDNIGWRVQEKDYRKFDRSKLAMHGVKGPNVRLLEQQGELVIAGKRVHLEDVSWVQAGDAFAIAIDSIPCPAIVALAEHAKVFLCESTYLEEHRILAEKHHHLTALQAAVMAKEAGVKTLILTHFSARYPEVQAFVEEAQTVFPNTFAAEDLRVFPF